MTAATSSRCAWAQGDKQMQAYHDEEWGQPEYHSRALFEKLMLDGMQAGLSWRTILHRRTGMRHALDDFDPHKMAAYDDRRMAVLLQDTRLIRNRLKLLALVGNAKAYLRLTAGEESFSSLLWGCVQHQPQQHQRSHLAPVPTENGASKQMSALLKNMGFKFVGPTICYAFMQAVGMVNDHDSACPKYAELGGKANKAAKAAAKQRF